MIGGRPTDIRAALLVRRRSPPTIALENARISAEVREQTGARTGNRVSCLWPWRRGAPALEAGSARSGGARNCRKYDQCWPGWTSSTHPTSAASSPAQLGTSQKLASACSPRTLGGRPIAFPIPRGIAAGMRVKVQIEVEGPVEESYLRTGGKMNYFSARSNGQ